MASGRAIQMKNINSKFPTTIHEISSKEMQYIFDFISLPQKLEVEKVCRRWRWLMPYRDSRLDTSDFPISFTNHSAWNHDGFPANVRDVDKFVQLLELLICTKGLGRHLIELKIAEIEGW